MRSALRSTVIVAACSAFASVAHADLIAYFPFEGGLVNDASGNGVVATNNGATTAIAGYSGNALSFNGSSSFVNVNLDINISVLPQLTMGAWVKPGNQSNLVTQIISHDNFGFDRSLCLDFRGGGGTTWSAFTGTGVRSGVAPVLNEWVFIAVSYNQAASSLRLHVNGQNFTATTNFGPGQSILNIGRNPNGNGEYFTGLIDEVFFFNEALSVDAIEGLRTNGVPTPGAAGLAVLAGLAATRRHRGR